MNVLLIGDSIRKFYEKEVQALLGDEYNCYSPEDNCRFSAFVLNSLRFWLPKNPTPDIIHWNAGLWDTAILYHEDGCFNDIETYVENMKKILRELKKTGAKIIFATTTPVHSQKYLFEGPMPPAHRNEDIIKYNKAVLDAFKDEDIVINDLFSVLYPEQEKYLNDDWIHPNEEGVKLLGRAVADKIKAFGVVKNTNNIYKEDFVVNDEKTIQ